MANKYPYASSAGGLIKTINHLRRSFPSEVTADTLRKLGVAPKNESYVINVLRFLGVIDEQGGKVDAKTKAFVQHKEESFAEEFEKIVRDAYAELFELRGDDAWTLDLASLIQFFRTSDHSTEIVGTRQAKTFMNLAALAGHAELPPARETQVTRKPPRPGGAGGKGSGRTHHAEPSVTRTNPPGDGNPRFGLTVRIEVNLPAEGDQQTYDRIFRSIRKNLIDGE